jgi:hypothetical protein
MTTGPASLAAASVFQLVVVDDELDYFMTSSQLLFFFFVLLLFLFHLLNGTMHGIPLYTSKGLRYLQMYL